VGPKTEKVGQGFPGVLGSLVFLALRWTMLEKVLMDVTSWCWLYLAAKPSHVGADVDGLAYPLHHPMSYSHQTRGQGLLSGTALSHRAVVGGGAFLGDAKPPGLDICWRVDRLGTCVTESHLMSEPPWHLGMYR
jgi:hypothetical protein